MTFTHNEAQLVVEALGKLARNYERAKQGDEHDDHLQERADEIRTLKERVIAESHIREVSR